MEPSPALDSGHCRTQEFDPILFESSGGFLSTADVFAGRGVIHLLAEVSVEEPVDDGESRKEDHKAADDDVFHWTG